MPIDLRYRIRDALAALLTREPGDAFVIFEDKAAGKFVQFAGSSEEPLLLDLPSQPLSKEEFARAKTFFASHGVQPKSPYPSGEGPVSFNLHFQSPDEAADTVLAIFQEVYGYSEMPELTITEN